MKAKASIGLGFVLLVMAAIFMLAIRREESIQVSGDLSELEISDICSAVRRRVYPPVLPDLSGPSLRAAPGLILQRLGQGSPRIWKIEARTYGFVAVIGRSPKDEVPRPYVFWGVFRGTNDWHVENEYHY
jgi:hypothetical protein